MVFVKNWYNQSSILLGGAFAVRLENLKIRIIYY